MAAAEKVLHHHARGSAAWAADMDHYRQSPTENHLEDYRLVKLFSKINAKYIFFTQFKPGIVFYFIECFLKDARDVRWNEISSSVE